MLSGNGRIRTYTPIKEQIYSLPSQPIAQHFQIRFLRNLNLLPSWRDSNPWSLPWQGSIHSNWTAGRLEDSVGFEPTTFRLTVGSSTAELQVLVVGIIGIEPITFRVSGECSNQLSYIPLLHTHKDSNLGQRFWRPVWYHFTMNVYRAGTRNRTEISGLEG